MSSTWRLFRGSSMVRKQLAATPGVVGFSLLARPLRKQYATLSVWVDDAALAAFAAAQPHADLMTGLAPEMGPTRFVRWTINGSDGRPSWERRCTAALKLSAESCPRGPAYAAQGRRSERSTVRRAPRARRPAQGDPAVHGLLQGRAASRRRHLEHLVLHRRHRAGERRRDGSRVHGHRRRHSRGLREGEGRRQAGAGRLLRRGGPARRRSPRRRRSRRHRTSWSGSSRSATSPSSCTTRRRWPASSSSAWPSGCAPPTSVSTRRSPSVGVQMATYVVNELAVANARRLIDARQYVLRQRLG